MFGCQFLNLLERVKYNFVVTLENLKFIKFPRWKPTQANFEVHTKSARFNGSPDVPNIIAFDLVKSNIAVLHSLSNEG